MRATACPIAEERDLDIGRFDYQAERKAFIAVKLSARTRSGYSGALRVFEEWLGHHAVAPTDLTPVLAAQFIRDLQTEPRKDPFGIAHPRTDISVRAIITACSSFYSHLERRDGEIRNPFRGILAAGSGSAPEQSPRRATIVG